MSCHVDMTASLAGLGIKGFDSKMRVFCRKQILMFGAVRVATPDEEYPCLWCGLRHHQGTFIYATRHGIQYPLGVGCRFTIDRLLSTAASQEHYKLQSHMMYLFLRGLPKDTLRIIVGLYWSMTDIGRLAADALLV